MTSEESATNHNVDDIIAQYDSAEINVDGSHEINVDDLIQMDLDKVMNDPEVLETPNGADVRESTPSKSKPKLNSTLPKPIAPELPRSDDIAPDLPHIRSPLTVSSPTSDHELDIESILRNTSAPAAEDPLLDFDPNGLSMEDLKASEETTTDSAPLRKYADIKLDSISNLLKREEIRMKQGMECGNYEMMEPLSKRMANRGQSGEKESFFKLSPRQSITKTLEHHRSEYGPPTFLKTHTKFIAMGMKNGSVFIFDHFEQLKVELTPPDLRQLNMGSVTCLDFNYNASTLVVGYQGGQLVLWDIINKKELKKVKDAHSSAIVFVMFYRRGALRIASCDAKGIMFTWSFSKIFFSYQVDRSVLFNGRKAGVLYDISLHRPNPNHRHILDSLSLCAVANHESVFFVTLEPPLTLQQTILLPNTNLSDLKRGALPMLTWRKSYSTPTAPPPPSLPSSNLKPVGQSRSISVSPAKSDASNTTAPTKKMNHFETLNPVLAVGSGTVIQLIEVFIRDEKAYYQSRDASHIRMRGIGQIQLEKLVIAMRWLNEENLVILTANDEICVCNGWPLDIAETIWPIPKGRSTRPTARVSMDFFIRHQYFGKNIICFKNCLEVIAGLDRNGQNNKLVVTTNSSVVTAHCMTWHDRIEKLIREGEWIKACCLVIEFFQQYEAGNIAASQSVARLLGKVDGYILQFCEFVVQSNKISDDELASFGGVAMDYCVCLKRTGSLLFDRVYTIFLEHGGREIFFKLLEPYILNDRIVALPPQFTTKFAEFCVSKEKLAELEQIILHLSPQSFDIHQMVSLCRQHKLFMALCYLYNTTCLDYAAPIQDMFYQIMNDCADADDFAAKPASDMTIQRGYQLMLYLKYTMNGTTFPWCNVLSTPLRAKQQILHQLFDGKQQYRILRHLLALNLKETLFHIVRVAFEDQHLFRTPHSGNSSVNSSTPNPMKASKSYSSSNSDSFDEMQQRERERRTSIQIKGMLSNAQSAVLSGAKWAWSATAGSAQSSPDHSRTNSGTGRRGGRLPGIAALESDHYLLEKDSLDPNIQLKSKQEMLSILVKIVIEEDDDGITTQQAHSEQQRAERAVFYEFCTPLLASGECEVNIGLLHNVLDFLFAESLKLQSQIGKLRGTQRHNVLSPPREAPPPGDDMEQENTPRMQRELKALVQTQHNFENTILILLSRKMETDKQHFKMRDLLRKAKESQFHKVELYLHREAGDHAAVIDSYLADDDLRVQVFEYINNLFYDIRHKYEVAQEHSNKDQFVVAPHPSNRLMASNKMGRVSRPDMSVIKIVLERLHKLVVIDAEQCGEVIFTWFPDPDRGSTADREDNRFFQNAVNALQHQSQRKTQYLLMKQIVLSMQSLQSKQLSTVSLRMDDVSEDQQQHYQDHERSLNSMQEQGLKVSNLEKLLLRRRFKFEQRQHELYIRLLCEFERESVLSYISANSEKFDIELIGRYCDKYQVLDASAYLKERSGDSVGALQLILKSINKGISELWDVLLADHEAKRITQSNVKNSSYYINCGKINKMMDELTMALGLCQRHTNAQQQSGVSDQQNTLWNHLLDSCLVAQQKINNEIKTPSYRHKYPSPEIRYLMKQTVNDVVSRTLTAMMTEKNIDLCDMFEKLVDKESSEKYEYYRDTIDVMLSTYKYETQMYRTANNLLRNGFHNTYCHHVGTAGHAFKTNVAEGGGYGICKLCDSAISDVNPRRLLLFYCGHVFHENCLYSLKQKRSRKGIMDHGQKCPICYMEGVDTDINKINVKEGPLNEKQRKLREQQEQEKQERNVEVQMKLFAKKLNRFKLKMKERDHFMERSRRSSRDAVSLSLAPANKDRLPKANPMDMHIPVAGWQSQFENNKHNACVIVID